MRIVLQSGRRIAVHRTTTYAAWQVGEGGGRSSEERTVVFCHSAPGAGIFDPNPAQTRARHVRLLSVDRPGYGRSDPLPRSLWSTVGAAADDLATVLDDLEVERVGVLGWSAGGRVALALAARRPDLVDRVVVVGTPAPDADVPWLDPEQRLLLEGLRALTPAEAHAELAGRLATVIPADPFAPEALWLLAAGECDAPALDRDGVRQRLGEMLEAAFGQGARGLVADIAGYCLQPWGFEPEQVEAKTLLLYGSRDPLAGPRHGRWWQKRLPNARLEVAPGAGHLLVVPAWPRILAHLAPGRKGLRLVDGSGRSESDAEVEEFSAA